MDPKLQKAIEIFFKGSKILHAGYAINDRKTQLKGARLLRDGMYIIDTLSGSGRDVRSTPNVIKLPKLFHDEVVLAYASPCLFDGKDLPLGTVLQSQDDDIRRAAGLRILPQFGCLKR